MPESFIDQNSNAGISLLSNLNMPFLYYLENNSANHYVENEEDYVFDENYEKEEAWVKQF